MKVALDSTVFVVSIEISLVCSFHIYLIAVTNDFIFPPSDVISHIKEYFYIVLHLIGM